MANIINDYVKEVICELRRDERMLALLRKSGLESWRSGDSDADHVARDWIEDVEVATSKKLPATLRSQVMTFTAKRWPMLLQRFNGDVRAAEQTMHNVLSTKYRQPLGEAR